MMAAMNEVQAVERFPGTERFEVRRAVGSGGFGTVYQVWDREHHQLVALKHLNRSDPQTLRRFKTEFRSLSNVSHLHLVSLYELHQRDADWFFTMEFVEGPSFAEHLRPEAAVAEQGRASSLKLSRPVPPASPPASGRVVLADERETIDPRSTDRPALLGGAPLVLPAAALAPTTAERDAALAPGLAPTTPFGAALEALRPLAHASPFHGIEAPDDLTLARWLVTRPTAAIGAPPDAERVRGAFRQLVEALAWLHASGHLHRDVKPSNVLVAPGDVVKVLDFGLVTRLLADDVDSVHALVGTPAYMAPELCAGLGASPASDWYSVGVMLYLVLTGQLPFGGDLHDLVLAKQALDARPPRELCDVPSDLEDLCLALLAKNPVERPDAAAFLDALGHGRRAPAHPTAATAVAPARFVGRKAEVAALTATLSASPQGPDVALVAGLSGLGKSTLVEHVLRAIEDANGALVLRSRCFERGSVRYRALDGAIDDLAGHLAASSAEALAAVLPTDPFERAALARLFPALPGLDDDDARVAAAEPAEVKRRAFSALRGVFLAVARERGLVIAIDDAQWADEDSLTPLAELLRPSPELDGALRWVIAYRSDEVDTSPFLRAFFDTIVPQLGARVTSISLGPLAPDEALALASSAGGADAHVIVAEAEGSPLLIAELARAGDAAPRPADATARTAGATLAELLAARVAELPDTARAALELIAIAGEPVPAGLVRAATGVEQRELNRLVQEHLVAARRHAGGEVVMAWHDRVRETVSAGLSGAARVQRHRELAQTAEAQGGADALFLHTHWREAGELLRAHPHGLAAAEAARRAFAFDRASDLYRQLIAGRGPDAPTDELRALHEALGNALHDAGRGTSAAKAYLDASERASDPVEVRRLEIRAAEQYLFAGAFGEGEAVIRKVLGRVGLSVAHGAVGSLARFALETLRTRLRGASWTRRAEADVPNEQLALVDTLWSATIGLSMAQPLASQAIHQRHLRAAYNAGEPGRIARALTVSLAFSGLAGGKDERKSDALYAQTDAIVRTLPHPYYGAFIAMAAGATHWLRGRWSDSRRESEAALAVYERDCTGVTWEVDTTRFLLLTALAHESDLPRLAALYEAILADAIERGDLYMETQIRTRFGPLLDLLDDAPERARASLQKALSRWQASGFQVVNYWGYLNRVDTFVYEGDGASAWRELIAGEKAVKRSLLLMGQYYRVQFHALIARAGLLALSAPAAAEHKSIARRVKASIARLAKEDMPWSTPKAQLFAGLRATGNLAGQAEAEAAASALAAAADGFSRASMAGHQIAASAAAARARGDQPATAAALARFASWGARAPERFLRLYTGV